MRTLHLPGLTGSDKKSPLQLSDILTSIPFRGPEYIIPPGVEGIANLVFDVHKYLDSDNSYVAHLLVLIF